MGHPKLPIPGKRNILITSALPYVNNVPHIGNISGSSLPADVFARYSRERGRNVLFVCGTDEYGTATETKALLEHSSPKDICDKYHAIHREIYQWFDLSFDVFGRTTSQQHTELCQSVFKKLLENNWLSDNTAQQLYCDNCQRSLADRLVEGTCPFDGCSSNSARGDQCEECGEPIFDPTDLIEPRCKNYINHASVAGGWSKIAVKETRAWLKKGLKPQSISRDLSWGVPVPLEKFKDKVFYVWFDAPIGYASITACYTPDWEQWWKNPENVELYQFMGKDNVRFHTVMFASTLLGAQENWTLMKTISATAHLQYEGKKFSKSKGIGVFGNDAKDTNIPVEVWRYYLLINRPEVSDTKFSWSDLQSKLNNELLKNLGNFINRVLSFIAKPRGYGSIIPDAPGAELHALTNKLAVEVGNYVEQYIEAMDKVKLKKGLKTAMRISSEGNAYLQESQFWKLYKEDQPSCSVVMRTSAGLVYILACLLRPFMPSFSIKVFKQLNMCPEQASLCDGKGVVDRAKTPWEILPAGHKIGAPGPLFKELKDEEVDLLKTKLSGHAERAEAESAAKIAEQHKKTKFPDGGRIKQQTKMPSAKPKSKSIVEVENSIDGLDVRADLIKKAPKLPGLRPLEPNVLPT